MTRQIVILGDSTSGKELSRKGAKTEGWARYVNVYLDETKYTSHDRCVIGWGIRDFFNRTPDWIDRSISVLGEGDILLACFGTLERSPLSRTDFGGFGARGSLFGQDDRYEIVYDEHYKVEYKVHTFGWYLKQLAQKAKNKGAKVYFLSQVPRNTWENGHHKRTYSIEYAKIMESVANEINVGFLDINQTLSEFLERIGEEKAKTLYSPTDKSHTTPEGAEIYAEIIVDSLKDKFPETFNTKEK
jgi:hypothetical protein